MSKVPLYLFLKQKKLYLWRSFSRCRGCGRSPRRPEAPPPLRDKVPCRMTGLTVQPLKWRVGSSALQGYLLDKKLSPSMTLQ